MSARSGRDGHCARMRVRGEPRVRVSDVWAEQDGAGGQNCGGGFFNFDGAGGGTGGTQPSPNLQRPTSTVREKPSGS